MAIRPEEQLIVDRKISDIKQRTTKGNYSKDDFNRIQHWQIYLRDLLNENGYYCNINPHEDWNNIDPRQSDVDKIKNDTKILKDAYYTIHDYDLHIGKTSVDYITANDIEKIFEEIEYLISCMQQNYIYCGVANCGSNRVWQQRFRRY